MEDPWKTGHELPWHTESCFICSLVISCSGKTDRCKCRVCGKEWEEPCSFNDEFK